MENNLLKKKNTQVNITFLRDYFQLWMDTLLELNLTKLDLKVQMNMNSTKKILNVISDSLFCTDLVKS